MHIAFLTSEYPHPKIKYSAGIGTSIKNLATELVNQGEKVTIFVYSQDKSELFEDNGITIHKIKHIKYSFLGWYLYRKYLQNYINKIIVKEKIELIEAPDWTGITAFMNLNCPIVIRLHGSDAYFCNLEGRKQKFKNYIFEKIALKSTDVIIGVSEFAAIKTKEIFNIKCDIRIIPNGIDLENFKNNNAELFELNTLLYFGTIIRKKGILELAYIFNEIIQINPKVKLTLLGKDVKDYFGNKSTLELFMNKLSSKAKKNVFYISEVSYNEVKNYISKAAVIVLPSFAEAFPMTWLEAMAMGKAMVTSNIGWATELMIDGKTGFTVNPKNHKLYAKKIMELLNDEKLNFTFGINAKKQILSNFTQKIITKKDIEFYKSILEIK